MKTRLMCLLLTLVMLLSIVSIPVSAEETEEIIITPTKSNCIEFSGWTGGSSLKRYDGKTTAPTGSGVAKFIVPEHLDGFTTLYYYVPKYASGYTNSICCAMTIEIADQYGEAKKYSLKITSGNGGEWVPIACTVFSKDETETVNMTGGGSGQNRLTDIKFSTNAPASYHILPDDFVTTGSWASQNYLEDVAYNNKILVSNSTSGGNAVVKASGVEPGEYNVYIHSVDFDYSTGNRKFCIKANGQKYFKAMDESGNIRYFGSHLVGTALENSIKDPDKATPYFGWEKMTYPSDKITVGEDGNLVFELVAVNTFARLDAIVLTKSDKFDLSTPVATGIAPTQRFPAEIPYQNNIAFPQAYTGKMSTVESTASLSNSHTTVSFKKGILANGNTMVQREVKSDNVVTVPYENGLGFMSLYADKATNYQSGGYYGQYYTSFRTEDNSALSINTQNVFRSGIPEWLIPKTLEQVDANTVRMTADGTYASIVATWTLSENDLEPKVTVTATAKKDGELSFGFFNDVQEVRKGKVGYVLNPYRWQERRLPDPGVALTETNSTTDHAQMTYKMNEAGQEITLGVAVDQSSIDLTVPVEGSEYEAGRWVHDMIGAELDKQWLEDKLPDGTYKKTYLDFSEENADFVINITGNDGGVLPAVFAPKISSIDSTFKAGETYTFSYRPLSVVSESGENRGWYDAYKHVAQDLRGVYDYRDNYYSSMTDAAFNLFNFLKDDEASGWDTNMVGHYNIEDSHWATNSNGLVYLQNYLLTEDDELLMNRTLPSMGSILTRSSSHIHNRFSIRNQSEGPLNKELEYTSIPMGNATFEGAYLLSRGQMPVYRKIAKNRFMNTTVESAGLGIKNTTDYYWYERANNSTDFPLTIENANKYLEERSFLSSSHVPDIESFINISYTPQFQAQLDAYEITGDEKYLEGAVEGARRFLPSLRITDIPESKDTMYVENTEHLVAQDKRSRSSAWSIADFRYRRGAVMEPTGSTIFENGAHYTEYTNRGYDEDYLNVRDLANDPYPAWVTARTGLGVEQFSTCLEGRNIAMSTWAGDVLRLGYLSGDQLMMDLARSSLVGRFSNYPGYYITTYTRLYGLENYPTDSFDITSLYFHHAPVFLSAVQDYLFSNAYVKSEGKVDFPNTRIQGYAWFNNRIYGHEAGVMYDEEDMWPWLKEGTITVSSKQIDWVAGRKQGRAAFVLTNAGDNDENITVTFNKDLLIADGALATVYDKDGNTSSATISDNKLNITVPKKGIVTIAVSGEGIHIPEYARIKFDETEQKDLGSTALGLMYEGRTYSQSYSSSGSSFDMVYNPNTGYDVKAYALSLAPDSYMGYIFVGARSTEQHKFVNENGYDSIGGGDGEEGIIKTTLKWHFEGEDEITTVEDSEFPYEFFIPVTDRSKKIVFNVETQYKNETRTLDKEYTIAPQEIALQAVNSKASFEPVVLSSALRTLSGTGTTLSEGEVMFGLINSTTVKSAFGDHDITEEDALKDCYLSGYVTVSDISATSDINESGYLLFDNVPIVQSKDDTSARRIAFSLDSNHMKALNSTNASDWADKDENSNYLGVKQGYMYVQSRTIYDFSNLYITNASNDNKLSITKDGNNYTISSNGAKCCFIVIADYDNLGKFTNVSVENAIISLNNSKSIALNDNQKMFVWESDVNRGTTLKPLFEVKTVK